MMLFLVTIWCCLPACYSAHVIHVYMHTLSSIIKYKMKKDEEDIQAVMRAIQSFIVPFDDDGEELVSLMSGSVASPKAQDDLLSVRTQAEKKMNQSIDSKFSPLRWISLYLSRLQSFQHLFQGRGTNPINRRRLTSMLMIGPFLLDYLQSADQDL